MAGERFLVTGALGCIGAWVIRLLIREGITASVFDLAGNPHRLRLILSDEELAFVRFIHGDISDFPIVEEAIKESGSTHIIHLAALQVPFCKADPPLGASVNVVGTVNIFEAAKRAGLQRVVYASSVAVYGASEDYDGPVTQDAPLKPRTHYGVYKQANEGTARIYWMDDRISSIGLRPYVVYGPGRDQGITSGPTKAMLAAAAGLPYHISFGGRALYQYAEDVARSFIIAARAPFEGAGVFNVPGRSLDVSEIISAIEVVAPSSRGRITFDPKPLPLPENVDFDSFTSEVGPLQSISLEKGVAATIDLFREAQTAGKPFLNGTLL